MTKVDSRDWYCPACDRMCDPSEITNREYHQHCGCFVGGWVQAFSKRLDDINDLEVALGQKDEQWHMAVEEVRRLTAKLADLRAQLDELEGDPILTDDECARALDMIDRAGWSRCIAAHRAQHTAPIRAQLDEAHLTIEAALEHLGIPDDKVPSNIASAWAELWNYHYGNNATLPTGDAEKGSGG